MLMMQGAGRFRGNDVGCGAVSWRAQGQLMLMMQGAGGFVESARAADAHDAGCGAVSWRAQGQLMQLMLMMQGAGWFRGERKGS